MKLLRDSEAVTMLGNFWAADRSLAGAPPKSFGTHFLVVELLSAVGATIFDTVDSAMAYSGLLFFFLIQGLRLESKNTRSFFLYYCNDII